ncbi:hypothetical protein QOZ80_8BG0658940 [Eleusine coracana subsp. coracana]|nr:hypothetical protein QOZ80_8BG0658940 [Eleusine coracana subsp. coracana]
MSLSRFSHWIWPGSRSQRTCEPPAGIMAMKNGLLPDSPSGFREPGAVGFPRHGGGGARPRKGKSRRRGGRGDSRVDREYDMVIVPSDGGGGLSDSDSDCSDWSIGWLEPHARELQSDEDSESSFSVLVPCYRRGRIEQTGRPDGRFSGPGGVSDSQNFVDQWLSSLQT